MVKPGPRKTQLKDEKVIDEMKDLPSKKLKFWEKEADMTVEDEPEEVVIPGLISSITKAGFLQGPILARVSSKSTLREFTAQNGKASIFSFTLFDVSGEVLVTAYREDAERLFSVVLVDTVVELRNFSVKAANPKFSKLGCPWEIVLTKSSAVQEVAAEKAPPLAFNFRTVAEIAVMEDLQMFDFIGVCVKVGDVDIVNDNKGGTVAKRTLTLLGEIGVSTIELTLWNTMATDFASSDYPVVVIRHGICKSFMGVNSISLHSISTLLFNPDYPAAKFTREWFDDKMAGN